MKKTLALVLTLCLMFALAIPVFAVVPIIILFVLFQKYFISGMTAGGVKG